MAEMDRQATLTSREVLAQAGISRATLNNYIALGILPRPQVARGANLSGRRVPRIGHFPSSALSVIAQVERLKREGYLMSEIVDMLKNGTLPAPQPATAPVAAPRALPPSVANVTSLNGNDKRVASGGLRLTLDQIESPAYLVNGRFELEWANDQAQRDILGGQVKMSADISERNLFTFLLRAAPVRAAADANEIMRFHMAIAKKRMPRASLFALGRDLESGEVEHLTRLHDAVETESAGMGQIAHAQVNFASAGEPARWFDLYASFFREGVFFTYHPAAADHDMLMQVLSRRDVVIRDLLKKRRPYLTEVAVLVADLQDSVKICAELPPEQYFQLINDVWQVMEPKLRRYYATHGKHVGDGVLYYFLPQPDSSHIMNALACARDISETMRAISRDWKGKKNWLNELVLNIGVHAGQEWFGTYQTPTHIEFTVLGDTVNMAGRLSDFARDGAIWASKTLLGKLTSKERERIRYGIRRRDADGRDVLVPETYGRIANLVDLANPKYGKFNDIATLPVTEILDVRADEKTAATQA